MKKKCIAAACVTLLSFGAASVAMAANSIDLEAEGWVKLTEGVYQREDADGNVTRLGFGAGGAQYDRKVLEKEIRALEDKIAFGDASPDAEAELAEHKRALAGIPVVSRTAKASSGPQIMSSQSGVLCGLRGYSFDSHFVVGKTGATAVARTGLGSDDLGPSPPITGITQYARGIVTPTGGTPIVTTNMLSDSSTVGVSAIANWLKDDAPNSAVVAANCSGSTRSYISLNISGVCTVSTGGYASMDKTYSTCVTTP